ncbi:hypothetical protein C9374_005827 [Naegleria lovaniensis]|uniref:DUF4116 domain-containing protein n=1 Tax=Naegleria lovaniensis TaxID=51637 RepID=A0AA88GQ54_NAELO|nr:uncharacterized protein C9374_005827 [Naegleria lovaniensis]KAG2382035.1 hypothetical protein C9374_005827 [Naegleria lovaniensis]
MSKRDFSQLNSNHCYFHPSMSMLDEEDDDERFSCNEHRKEPQEASHGMVAKKQKSTSTLQSVIEPSTLPHPRAIGHVRILLVDLSSCNSHEPNDANSATTETATRWEWLLKKKFSLQQLGKKKWLLNRELRYLTFFPVEFMNDREFVLNHISKYGYGVNYASKLLQQDKEVVLKAAPYRYDVLFYAAEELRSNKEFVLEVVQVNGKTLFFASSSLKSDKDVALAAVRQNGLALKSVNKNTLHKHHEIVEEAVKQNNSALRFVPTDLLKDHDFMLKMLKLTIPELSTFALFDNSNKELMMKLVRKCGVLLQIASDELKEDRGFVLDAVKNDWEALAFASETLRKDKHFILSLVSEDGRMLQYAASELKQDKEVVLAAVRNNVAAIYMARGAVLQDKEVVFEAIKGNMTNICLASPEHLSDKQFVLDLAKLGCHSLLKYIPKHLANENEFMETIVKELKNSGCAIQTAIDEPRREDLQAQYDGYSSDYSHQLYQKRMEQCYFGAKIH